MTDNVSKFPGDFILSCRRKADDIAQAFRHGNPVAQSDFIRDYLHFDIFLQLLERSLIEMRAYPMLSQCLE